MARFLATNDSGETLATSAARRARLGSRVPTGDLVVSVIRTTAGGHPIRFLLFSDGAGETLPLQEHAAALLTAEEIGSFLAVTYSDSSGASSYSLRRAGHVVATADRDTNGRDPTAIFREGLEIAFPGCGIVDPDDLVTTWYDPPAAESADIVVARTGRPLLAPEPWSRPQARPATALGRLLAGEELAWGRKPRAVLVLILKIFGALGLLGMVVLAAWALWESR